MRREEGQPSASSTPGSGRPCIQRLKRSAKSMRHGTHVGPRQRRGRVRARKGPSRAPHRVRGRAAGRARPGPGRARSERSGREGVEELRREQPVQTSSRAIRDRGQGHDTQPGGFIRASSGDAGHEGDRNARSLGAAAGPRGRSTRRAIADGRTEAGTAARGRAAAAGRNRRPAVDGRPLCATGAERRRALPARRTPSRIPLRYRGRSIVRPVALSP